jgi:hypothetical protein
MGAAREQPEALRGLLHHLGFWQDAAPDSDHGVGGEDQRIVRDAGLARLVLGGQRLLVGEPRREFSRQLALFGRLVDMGRDQMLGLDADLVQKREPARRGRGENQFGTAGHLLPVSRALLKANCSAHARLT